MLFMQLWKEDWFFDILGKNAYGIHSIEVNDKEHIAIDGQTEYQTQMWNKHFDRIDMLIQLRCHQDDLMSIHDIEVAVKMILASIIRDKFNLFLIQRH